MSDKDQAIKDLEDIKGIMEQSTRFISLSGLSGVFSGVFALIGGSYLYVYFGNTFYFGDYKDKIITGGELNSDFVIVLFSVSLLMLLFSFVTGIVLTVKKAKKIGQNMFGKQSMQLVSALMIPLVTGGFFCLVLLSKMYIELLAPCTLIFYGLALINASKYTLHDIKFLGIIEIVLAFMAMLISGYALLFWMLGFGVMHIIYGTVMYYKYERKK